MCSDASVEARMSRQQPRPHAHTCEGVNVLLPGFYFVGFLLLRSLCFKVLASRMDLGGGKGSFGEVCLSANVCVQSGFSLPQGEAPPPGLRFPGGSI